MKEFLTNLIKNSSKRIIALLAFIAVLFMAFFKYDVNVILAFLSFICALLGLGTVDKFTKPG